ncbi:MAG: 50S ribosomal protein L22 [Candidatus Diapherotrites archaeon]|nr:50S ribosomal protein L22 [Candidatus Diapherotrites archaeon]
MAQIKYQAEVGKASKTARAMITNAPISVKYSTEICNQVKTKPVNQVIEWLRRIENHEEYLPLKRYHKKVAHRKGNALNGEKAGRYPEKVARGFIKLLELVKANADFKGLDAEKLLIIHAYANMGMNRFSYQSKGRIAGKARRRNATNIEVIVQEMK